MVSAIDALPAFQEESLYTTEKQDNIGRDSFIKLFLAQLNHQDPLSPMNTENFGAQIAQFSTVEQLYNANESLEDIKGIQSGDSKYHALDLMGKEVQAQSDKVVLGKDSSAKGAFYLDTAAEGCVIRIYDDNGKAVKDIDLEDLPAGTHSFEWDGRDEDGNLRVAGVYTYDVSAVSPEGDFITAEKYVQGTVTRVSLYEDEPVIYVNDTPMSMEQIVNIKVPGSEETAEDTSDETAESSDETEA